MIDLNFYQNYRQRYTVIPITTVRGPFIMIAFFFFKTVFQTVASLGILKLDLTLSLPVRTSFRLLLLSAYVLS